MNPFVLSRHSRESGNPGVTAMPYPHWIPACAGMTMGRISPTSLPRHAELVSASIAPLGSVPVSKWTLKQVQGDDRSEGRL